MSKWDDIMMIAGRPRPKVNGDDGVPVVNDAPATPLAYLDLDTRAALDELLIEAMDRYEGELTVNVTDHIMMAVSQGKKLGLRELRETLLRIYKGEES